MRMSDKLKRQNLTFSQCFNIARGFSDIVSFRLKDREAFDSAWDNGWFDECTSHMRSQRTDFKTDIWNIENCFKEARLFPDFSSWMEYGEGFKVAKKYGWLGICGRHFNNVSFDKDSCKEVAKTYKSIGEWNYSDIKSYYFAKANEIFTECTEHMSRSQIHLGSKGDLFHSILHKSNSFLFAEDWMLRDGLSFHVAQQEGWLCEFTVHMIKKKSTAVKQSIVAKLPDVRL